MRGGHAGPYTGCVRISVPHVRRKADGAVMNSDDITQPAHDRRTFFQRMAVLLAGGLAIAILLGIQGYLQISGNRENCIKTSQVMIDHIIARVEQNAKETREITEEVKNSVIIGARTAAYVLSASPEAERSLDELKHIADLLSLDEIHIFDRQGRIFAGTHPQYYGYSFDSGPQMAFFKPMLTDRSLAMCQDMMPNTAEGKYTMYALVWKADGSSMVQVGIEPRRLIDVLKRNNLASSIANMNTDNTTSIVLADSTTNIVSASTDSTYVGKSLAEIGIHDAKPELRSLFTASIGDVSSYCYFNLSGQYRIGIISTQQSVNHSVSRNLLVSLVYMLIAGGLFLLIKRHQDHKLALMYLTRMREQAEARRRITEALETAQAASQAKSNFLRSISHDIRTPMNAIVGFTEILAKNGNNAEKIAYCIKNIRAASSYLLELVDNVLNISAIESGRSSLDSKPVNIDDLKESIISVFSEEIRRKHLNFSSSCTIVHRHLLADSTKIHQVLLNILSNAVKYTPEYGSIALTVTESPGSAQDMALYHIVVEDTGIGMSSSFLPHAFELFARERNSTQSGIQGTGLGLGIVKKLVSLMGGSIAVESREGHGTRVSIDIPARINPAPAMDDRVPRTAPSSMEQPFSFHGRRILLTEDNAINAEIAMAVLKDAGFEVDHAVDGLMCIDMLKKGGAGQYDLVLMDIQMPHLDGYDTTVRIRNLEDRALAGIPIVAMTANAFDEDRMKAFACGMNGYVTKPLQIAKLRETLREVLTTGNQTAAP